MAGTKVYFDQILDNQNQLMRKLSEYANEMAATLSPDPVRIEKAEGIAKAWIERPSALTETLIKKETLEKFQKDFTGTYTSGMKESMEMWKDLYQQSATYLVDTWTSGNATDAMEKMKKFTTLYQNSLQAVADATTANTKVIQDYFA